MKELCCKSAVGLVTYKLIILLSAHYSPSPSAIHSCFRNPGKSVATYVAELHSLAESLSLDREEDKHQ